MASVESHEFEPTGLLEMLKLSYHGLSLIKAYLSSHVSIIYFKDYSHYFALLKVTSLRGDRVQLVIYSQYIDLMEID